MGQNGLAIQLDEAERFLDFVAGDDVIGFRTFDDQERARVAPVKLYGSFEECSYKLKQQNEKGSGVFWVVNHSKDKNQTDSSIDSIRAVFVDLDGAPLFPVFHSDPAPHVILESSKGKYHAYWLVTGDFPVSDFSRFQKALAKKFKGDPSVHNLSRVMRIPGFVHQKDPSNKFVTRIMEMTSHFPYSPEDLREGLLLDLDSAEEKHLKVVHGCDGLGRVIPNGTRDNTLFSRACSLRNAGLGFNEILDHLNKMNESECETPLPFRQIEKLARQAAKKESYADEPKELIRVVKEKNLAGKVEEKKRFFTFEEVCRLEIPELQWVIPEVLLQGLTVLAGAPKMGKSWLVQQLSLSISMGGMAMSRFITNQGSVLHLALEDPMRRFQDRLKAQLKPGEIPPRNGVFCNEFPLGQEGLDTIEEWCEQAYNPSMVVIDTLARFNGETVTDGNQTLYTADYRMMAGFHKLAVSRNLAVVVVHHLRKAEATDPMNMVSGSAGITGAADSVWVFTRKNRSAMKAEIQAMGKDVSDAKYFLEWDGKYSQWNCVDYINSEAESITSFKIKDIFMQSPGKGYTASEIGDILGLSRQHMNRALNNLFEDDYLIKKKGKNNTQVFYLNPNIF
jgi:hypothetical protein